jgi:uncharacterized protein YmfQ (DUF2313 family)
MDAAAYLQQLNALLPSGWLWNALRGDAIAQGLLGAVADELATIDARAGNVLDEGDPRTVVEMLPEWEEWLGLPDACSGDLGTVDQRRAAILLRRLARGGQSPAYFSGLAQALGYTAAIIEHQPTRYGARYGTDYSGLAWQTVFDVVATAGPAAAPASLLECAIRRAARADRHPRFIYE